MLKDLFFNSVRQALHGLVAVVLPVLFVLLFVGPSLADETPVSCQSSGTYDIMVNVQDLKSLNGLLTVELYNDDPDGFIKKSGRLQRMRLNLRETGGVACISAPGPGTYAIVVYHDENANRKFDKGFLGIPIEGFGVSRNPSIGFSAPELEEAAFKVGDSPISLSITMNYL